MTSRRAAASRRRLLCLLSGLGGSLLLRGVTAHARDEVVDVDLTDIRPGDTRQVTWRGQPVFVRHRSPDEIERARSVAIERLRDPVPDTARVRRAQWLVVIGVCTHGGCVPTGPLGRHGGWYCLCHGSEFDTSGRIREGPARENLRVPPYRFLSDRLIRIGEAAAP